MTKRTLKHKWLKTKIALNNTMQDILNLNRKRKLLQHIKNSRKAQEELESELRILNATADLQAQALRRYELVLADDVIANRA